MPFGHSNDFCFVLTRHKLISKAKFVNVSETRQSLTSKNYTCMYIMLLLLLFTHKNADLFIFKKTIK